MREWSANAINSNLNYFPFTFLNSTVISKHNKIQIHFCIYNKEFNLKIFPLNIVMFLDKQKHNRTISYYHNKTITPL